MLESFKKEGSFFAGAKGLGTTLHYLLHLDGRGAFVEVCDGSFKAIKDLSSKTYIGIDREIVQKIEQIERLNFFQVSWEESSEKIYLHDHEELVDLLVKSARWFTPDHHAITYSDDPAVLRLQIDESGEEYAAYLALGEERDFKLLTARHLLVAKKLYTIGYIGEAFDRLERFNARFPKERLEEFLSVFFTHYKDIAVSVEGYRLVHHEEQKKIKPAVLLEKITSERALVLRVSATLSTLKPEFFDNFTVSKVALVHTMGASIDIYDGDFSDVMALYQEIQGQLSTLKRTLGEGSFSEQEGQFVIEESLAHEFILQHLHTLLSHAELFGKEKLKSYNYTVKNPSLRIAFKDKVDLLGTEDITVDIGEDRLSLAQMLSLYKQHAFIPLSNGERSIVDREYIGKLERIFKKEKKGFAVSFFDLPEIEELIVQKDQKVFKDSRSFYEGFNKLAASKKRLPKLQDVTLRPYQKEGVKWLLYLYENNFGGCLADDMGLGKTLQMISLLSYVYPKEKTPSLVVVPKSLLSNWQREITRFNPALTHTIYHAADRSLKQIHNHQVIITTYAVVRNDIEQLRTVAFDTVILDESHHIKNLDSKISKAVMLLESKHKFAISGTPIENSLTELYALFRFINSGMFRSLGEFKKDYALPIQNEGNEKIAQILRSKISPFILRRLKESVLDDLPPKQEQVVYIDMEEEHRRFYQQKRDYYKMILDKQIEVNGIENSRFVIMQALNDLRQIAGAPELKSEQQVPSSKIDNLFEMLEDIVANNHKVLIFANYLGSLELIAARAEKAGYGHLMMTGSTRDRQSVVDRFQSDPSLSLLLMTLKVGGVGLNLTEADYVIIFDPWWNRSAENQAVDRAHRMGQKNKVFSYKLITKDTIEEKILELQSQKQELTDKIISGDESGLKQLSREDLAYILG
jgi:SNF2 family DNA or RNA helicase